MFSYKFTSSRYSLLKPGLLLPLLCAAAVTTARAEQVIEAERSELVPDQVVEDSTASGQAFVHAIKPYQPLATFDVPEGERFLVQARMRGTSVCLKRVMDRPAKDVELKWNYSKPEDWTWVSLGEFSREELGDRVLFMGGGKVSADAGLDAVAFGPPEKRPDSVTMQLWEGDPPGVVENAGPGISTDGMRIREVGIPGMTVYFPEGTESGRPVLLAFPGGGYHHVGRYENGNGVLDDFMERGVVFAVLKYRTSPPYDNVKEVSLLDAKRAVRLLRAHTKEWGIDPNRVGVIGWSAGANLALRLATEADEGDPSAEDPVERESSRPDVIGLLCTSPRTPQNSRIEDYAINEASPPAFIASARDDTTAPTSFSIAIDEAYRQASVDSKLWLIDQGGHMAFSAISHGGEGSYWHDVFWEWLTQKDPGWSQEGRAQKTAEDLATVSQNGLKAEDASLQVADMGTGPASPVTAEIVIKWDQPTVTTNRNQFSLNGSDAGSAAHTADPRYTANMDYMHPGHVRYHKHIVHRGYDYRKGGTAGWLNYDTRTWDRDVVEAAFASYTPEDAEILIAIPEWPTWMDKDGDRRLDPDQFDAYAQLCAELVQLLNIDLNLGIKQFEVSNERDFIYWREQMKTGEPILVSELADIFNRCAIAMKAVDPSIEVGGPTSCRAEEAVLDIHETFVRETLPNLDFYAFHVYATGDPAQSTVSIYDKVSAVGDMIDYNREMLDRVSPDRRIPIHLNEYNIFWTWKVNEPRMRNNIGAVFDSLFLVECAQHGLDVGNAWNECDAVYGKMNDKDFNLRPGAHVFHFFNNWMVGQAVDTASSEPQAVVPFAVETDDSHNFVLINRSPFENAVDLYFEGWEPLEGAVKMARIDESGLHWKQIPLEDLDMMKLPPDSVTFFKCK